MPLDTGYATGSAASQGQGRGASSDDDYKGGYSVEKLRQQYMDFSSAKLAEIEEQRLARHYYHGDQLTAAELKVLKKRGQPAVIRNKIDRKINAVVGLVERLRQDPKAYPRTPMEDERGGAEVATAAIRYVLDKPDVDDSEWRTVAAEAARNGAVNGIYGVELLIEQGDQDDPDIAYALVDADTFFYDPRTWRHSFSDARWMGVAKWVDLELAQEMFPEAHDTLKGLVSTSGGGLVTWQQQDREIKWIDANLKRVFLVEHWHIRKGEWHWCFYTDRTKLRDGKSPFIDEKGKTFCRFIMGSVNVDHDGDRYGFVRNLKSLQDEVNARATKGLHILNTRRIKATKGVVDDIEKTRTEAARPDGYIEINPMPNAIFEFDDQKSQADLQGQLEFLAEVKTEIENFGPNPALIGEGIENKSGRAIALLQQAGIAELGPFILSYRSWKIRVYRAIWNAIRHHWTAERWIRVTDDEGVAEFMGLNQLQMDENGNPYIDNMLGALDVDLILDEGPDTINLMQDTYDTLTALAQRGQSVPPQILIELAPIPQDTKRKLMGILEQAQQPPPGQVEGMQAELRATHAKAGRDEAESKATLAGISQSDAKADRDRAGVMHELADAARSITEAARPAKPLDGGLGQFERGAENGKGS